MKSDSSAPEVLELGTKDITPLPQRRSVSTIARIRPVKERARNIREKTPAPKIEARTANVVKAERLFADAQVAAKEGDFAAARQHAKLALLFDAQPEIKAFLDRLR